MSFLKILFLGIGLALGAGLVYALVTSEAMRLFAAFLVGAVLIGLVVLLVNRQWTQALGMQRHQTQTNNRFALTPPQAYPMQQPQFYNVPDSLPMIEGAGTELGDDGPVA